MSSSSHLIIYLFFLFTRAPSLRPCNRSPLHSTAIRPPPELASRKARRPEVHAARHPQSPHRLSVSSEVPASTLPGGYEGEVCLVDGLRPDVGCGSRKDRIPGDADSQIDQIKPNQKLWAVPLLAADQGFHFPLTRPSFPTPLSTASPLSTPPLLRRNDRNLTIAPSLSSPTGFSVLVQTRSFISYSVLPPPASEP